MIDKDLENFETTSIENIEKLLLSIEEFHKSTLALERNTKDGTIKQNGIHTLKHVPLQEFLKKCAQLNSRWSNFISSIKSQKLNGLRLIKLIKKDGIL